MITLSTSKETFEVLSEAKSALNIIVEVGNCSSICLELQREVLLIIPYRPIPVMFPHEYSLLKPLER